MEDCIRIFLVFSGYHIAMAMIAREKTVERKQ